MDDDESAPDDDYREPPRRGRRDRAGFAADTSTRGTADPNDLDGVDAFHDGAIERPRRIFVCIGPSCSEQKSRGILTELKKQIERHKLKKRVEIYTSTCLSQCLRAPAVQVFPEGTFYCRIMPRDVRTIVSEHLDKNRVVEHFVHDPFTVIRWNDEIDS